MVARCGTTQKVTNAAKDNQLVTRLNINLLAASRPPAHFTSPSTTHTHTSPPPPPPKQIYFPPPPHLQRALHLEHLDDLEKNSISAHTHPPSISAPPPFTHKPFTLSPTPSCLGALSIIPPPASHTEPSLVSPEEADPAPIKQAFLTCFQAALK